MTVVLVLVTGTNTYCVLSPWVSTPGRARRFGSGTRPRFKPVLVKVKPSTVLFNRPSPVSSFRLLDYRVRGDNFPGGSRLPVVYHFHRPGFQNQVPQSNSVLLSSPYLGPSAQTGHRLYRTKVKCCQEF